MEPRKCTRKYNLPRIVQYPLVLRSKRHVRRSGGSRWDYHSPTLGYGFGEVQATGVSTERKWVKKWQTFGISSIRLKFCLISSPLLNHFARVAHKHGTFQICLRRKPLVRWAHWWWKPCPFVAVPFTHQLPARVCDCAWAEELSGHGTEFRSLFKVGVLSEFSKRCSNVSPLGSGRCRGCCIRDPF